MNTFNQIKYPSRRSNARFYMLAIAILVAAFFIWQPCFTGTISDGERTGLINKLSNKGVIHPTWEGEMAIAGTINIWKFTIPDNDTLVEKAKYASENGLRVTCHYKQPLVYSGWNCRGDGYFITDIRLASTSGVEVVKNPFEK